VVVVVPSVADCPKVNDEGIEEGIWGAPKVKFDGGIVGGIIPAVVFDGKDMDPLSVVAARPIVEEDPRFCPKLNAGGARVVVGALNAPNPVVDPGVTAATIDVSPGDRVSIDMGVVDIGTGSFSPKEKPEIVLESVDLGGVNALELPELMVIGIPNIGVVEPLLNAVG
jgi:hypothetical protein